MSYAIKACWLAKSMARLLIDISDVEYYKVVYKHHFSSIILASANEDSMEKPLKLCPSDS